MEISRIDDEDFKEIIKNLAEYDDYWTEANYISAYNSPHIYIYKLPKLEGYIILENEMDLVTIQNIVVKKSERGKGFANILIEKALDMIDKDRVLLEVNEKNYIAISLYEKHGFKKISERKKYYGQDSAIIMEKRFK